MNAGSVLHYTSATFNQHRIIYLDEGEAFFQVTKDPKHPFEVYTSKLHTRVLGTSFNVKAYGKLHYTSVLVKTGHVRVTVKNMEPGAVITASQGLVYNNITGLLQRNDLPAEESGSWVNGITMLHEASFDELALVFYNRYKQKLSSTNPDVLKYHYTITLLQNKSVESALKLICNIHNNQYRRKENELIIY